MVKEESTNDFSMTLSLLKLLPGIHVVLEQINRFLHDVLDDSVLILWFLDVWMMALNVKEVGFSCVELGLKIEQSVQMVITVFVQFLANHTPGNGLHFVQELEALLWEDGTLRISEEHLHTLVSKVRHKWRDD